MNAPLSRVLVVEDREDDALILSHLLEKSGVVGVSVLGTAEAAAERLEAGLATPSELPMAAFIDVGLPGVNGFDLLAWIRRHALLSSMAVVLLSGTDEPRNLGKAGQLDADAYLVKYPPLSTMRELVSNLAQATAQPRPRAPVPVSCNLLLRRAG